jgi:hypothetical protein
MARTDHEIVLHGLALIEAHGSHDAALKAVDPATSGYLSQGDHEAVTRAIDALRAGDLPRMIHPSASAGRAPFVQPQALRQDQVGPGVVQRSDTPLGVATVIPGMPITREPGGS